VKRSDLYHSLEVIKVTEDRRLRRFISTDMAMMMMMMMSTVVMS